MKNNGLTIVDPSFQHKTDNYLKIQALDLKFLTR